MSTKEVWAICGDCGAELTPNDKQCPKCGSTKTTYAREPEVSVGLDPAGKAKQKRQGVTRPLREIIFNRWKRSGDPKLKNGVREDLVFDREKNEYHQVVKDQKTGKVTHEEHQSLSEHNKKKIIKRKLWLNIGKKGLAAIITIVVGLIGSFIWFYIVPILQKPQPPELVSSTYSNPIINSGNIATVELTATVIFVPPYKIKIAETIHNPNSHKCYMVLEFKASDGFLFLPISDNLSENFRVESGYEYKDIMKLYINDFPPKFTYNLILPIYTMDPTTFGGTETINMTVLEVQKE